MDFLGDKRIAWSVPVFFAAVGLSTHTSDWQSDSQPHVVLESMAMVVAMVVGGVSLMLYHTRHQAFFLLVGCGFFAAGLLDGYHAVVASSWAMDMTPSRVEAIVTWSWLASRTMLAALFVYAAYWLINEKKTEKYQSNKVYVSVVVLTLACIVLFGIVPLNDASINHDYFSRPLELIPGVLFVVAAVMMFISGKWRMSSLHHWILVAVVLNVIAQIEYMSLSRNLYDMSFDLAHLIKFISYVFVLVGLSLDMYRTYSQVADESEKKARLSESEKWNDTVRRQEAAHKAIVDGLPQKIYVKDLHGKYCFCNQNFANLMGKTRDQIIHQLAENIDPGSVVETYVAEEKRALESAGVVRSERMVEVGGGKVWYESQHYPYFNQSGEMAGVIGVFLDIELRKYKDTQIMVREAAISESSNAIAICDLSGSITYANHAMVAMFGELDEMLGLSVGEFLFQNQKEFNAVLARINDNQRWRQELKLTKEQGKSIYVLASAVLLHDVSAVSHGILISMTDISEQKRAMEALQRSEQTFSKAQEIAHIGSWDWDMETNDLSWSDEIYRIFGLQPKEFAATYEAFLACVHPDDRNLVIDSVNASIKDRDVEYSIEHRVVRRDGSERIVHEQGKVYWDTDGVPVRMIGTVLDITERKKVEQELERHRKDLEGLVEERTKELEQAYLALIDHERLATLGKLTAMVSHELRNPLAAMRPALHVLEKREVSDEKIAMAIERLDRNISRCDYIIDELLEFIASDELNCQEVDLDHWLASILASQTFPVNIRIVTEYGLSGKTANIDSQRLQRAVIHLLENAIQAMQDKDSGDHCLEVQTRRDGHGFEISVSDTGVGIDEVAVAKIFEPLFSTKNFGVGLGMPTVKRIMDQHGGDVRIRTEKNVGVTVALWIPEKKMTVAGEAA
ncbi:MAG: PAS domain S-box protein [Gammaproteobacteria bacterium]|nr:PAS domain S-box protein [Gammaproteobacteria bacterium]